MFKLILLKFKMIESNFDISLYLNLPGKKNGCLNAFSRSAKTDKETVAFFWD